MVWDVILLFAFLYIVIVTPYLIAFDIQKVRLKHFSVVISNMMSRRRKATCAHSTIAMSHSNMLLYIGI